MTEEQKAFAFMLMSIQSGDPWLSYVNGVAWVKAARREGDPEAPEGSGWDEHFKTAITLKRKEAEPPAPRLGCGCRTGCCPHSCSAHWTPDGQRRA